MKKLFLAATALNSAVLSFACAQNINQDTANSTIKVTDKIAPPQKVEGGNIKEVGLWGYYESVDGYDNLPTDLWVNSDLPLLSSAFGKLSDDQRFAPMQFLIRRVLLSGGISPGNDSFVAAQRFKTAVRLGPMASVSLLNNYPNLIGNQELALIAADSWFYDKRNEDACNVVEAIKPTNPNKELLQLRAACYALNNEPNAAQLSLDLAIGDNAPNEYDLWLSRAIAYIGNMNGDATPAYNPGIKFRADDGKTFALSQRIGLIPDKNQLQNLPSMALGALVKQNKNLSEEYYLNAVIKGAISYKEYASYKKDVTSITELPPIQKTIGESPTGPIIEEVKVAPYKGQNYFDELKSAKDIAAFTAIANRIAPKFNELNNINPNHAAAFANAAVLASDLKNAKRFAAQINSPDATLKLAIEVLGGNNAVAIAQRINTAQGSEERARFDSLLAYSTGLDVRSASFILNTANASKPDNDNILFAMELAADRNAQAETALLSAIALQKRDPKTIDAYSIARVIRALRKVGLDTEAKQLAVYTMMARALTFDALPKSDLKPLNNDKPTNIAPKPANSQINTSSVPKQNAPKAVTNPAPKPEVKSPETKGSVAPKANQSNNVPKNVEASSAQISKAQTTNSKVANEKAVITKPAAIDANKSAIPKPAATKTNTTKSTNDTNKPAWRSTVD